MLLIILLFVWAFLKGRSWWHLFQYRIGTSERVDKIQSCMTSQQTKMICINKMTVVGRPCITNWQNANFKETNESQDGRLKKTSEDYKQNGYKEREQGCQICGKNTVAVSSIVQQWIKENAYGCQDPRHVIAPKMMMSICSKLQYHKSIWFHNWMRATNKFWLGE